MKSTVCVIGLTFLLSACVGNNPEPSNDPDANLEPADDPDAQSEPGPDGVALKQRFDSNRANSVQTFAIDAGAGGTVTGVDGTMVTFSPNALSLGGAPVSGMVEIELVEVYDRSSMVLLNRSTNGARSDGSVEALKSAGQFYINATQGGTDLEILGAVTVYSRPFDPAQIDPEMNLFVAGTDVNDDQNWKEVEDVGDGQGGVGVRDGAAGGVSYMYGIGEFGWTNLDRWYSFPGALTQLYVQVPEGYDGDNCAVFLTYDGEPTALASMDVYDDELELFAEHYGLIPVGQQVHFILVTEIDGELHYAIQGATITDGHTEVMPEPLPVTQADLEAAINALP